jgi:hypothetical protein
MDSVADSNAGQSCGNPKETVSRLSGNAELSSTVTSPIVGTR